MRTGEPLRLSGHVYRRTETPQSVMNEIATRRCLSSVEFVPEPGAKYEATCVHRGTGCGWSIARRDAEGKLALLDPATQVKAVCRERGAR